MEPDFDLVEDGDFFRIFSEFVANDAPSSTQLLSISTQDLIPDKKGKYHKMDDKVDADDTLTLHIPKSVKQVILWKDGRRIALDT